MTSMQQPEPLNQLAWYVKAGWARKRGIKNLDRRRVPAVVVVHPTRGYATVSMASLPRFEALGCTLVEELH